MRAPPAARSTHCAPHALRARGVVQVGKIKQVALDAGVDEELCWFTAFGDVLALDPNRVKYNPNDLDAETWVFPELHAVKKPGAKLGGYVSDLLPRALGGAAGYQDVADKESSVLPSDASAAGFRAGACNTLVSSVTLESVVNFTGHDISHKSALFEYVDSSLAACMPGAIVMAGFPALPWGHNSRGPRPASLAALSRTDQGALNRMLDRVLQLDSGALPMFMAKSLQFAERGKLRPIAEHAFARCATHEPRSHAPHCAPSAPLRALSAPPLRAPSPRAVSPSAVSARRPRRLRASSPRAVRAVSTPRLHAISARAKLRFPNRRAPSRTRFPRTRFPRTRMSTRCEPHHVL